MWLSGQLYVKAAVTPRKVSLVPIWLEAGLPPRSQFRLGGVRKSHCLYREYNPGLPVRIVVTVHLTIHRA